METPKYEAPEKHETTKILVGILLFGSIWGFLEATLGGYLHFIIFPNKGAIMSGIGIAIMASALTIYRKPAMLPFLGIVSASHKLLDVWLFSLPVNSIHIINPAMAIIFESIAFSAVVILMQQMQRKSINSTTGMAAGVASGLISAIAYVYFAIYVTNSPLFQRIGVNSIAEFILGPGIVQAVFSGIFFPLGYLAGHKLYQKPFLSPLWRGSLYYATSAAVIVFCWVIAALAVKTGF